MGSIITAGILAALATVCFVLSWRQFRKKGLLLNNAYLYASKQQREQMDKTPHYRQTAIVLALVGVIFTLNAADAVLRTRWILFAVLGLCLLTAAYAIVSSVRIEKQKKQ